MKTKKGILISLLTALASLSTFSTDIYLPSLPELTVYFDTTIAASQLTLSVYMLGFALSMLFCGPLSDRYGRKSITLGGLALHLISTICCIFAKKIELLIIARFFQALGGCCGTVLGRVIARDIFKEKDCIKVLSYLSTGLSIALAFAPILGGFLQSYFDWRSSFIALAILSSLILILSFYLLDETLPYQKRKSLNFKTLFQNYYMFIRNRHFIGFTLAITFTWCGYFSFISGSSFVFINLMHVNPQNYGIIYALIITGYITGTILAGKLASIWDSRQSVFLGSLLALIGSLLMLVLTLNFYPNVFNLLFPMFFYLIGTGLIMPNAQAVVTNPFPELIGSASSLFYFIEMLFGAFAGGFVGMYLKNSSTPMVIAIVVSSILLFISTYKLIWKKSYSPQEN